MKIERLRVKDRRTINSKNAQWRQRLFIFVTNNIIFGQAFRHVIVHSGGYVSERMIKQISKATPRTLKPNITAGEKVFFSNEEVVELKTEILTYINRVVASIEAAQ